MVEYQGSLGFIKQFLSDMEQVNEWASEEPPSR